MQVDMVDGQGVTLRLPCSQRQRRWINSLLEWLTEAGIHLSRHGVRGAVLGGDQPILDYLPEGPDLRTILTGLAEYGLSTLSDLASLDSGSECSFMFTCLHVQHHICESASSGRDQGT